MPRPYEEELEKIWSKNRRINITFSKREIIKTQDD
jgi:hypothetical protein